MASASDGHLHGIGRTHHHIAQSAKALKLCEMELRKGKVDIALRYVGAGGGDVSEKGVRW